MDMLFFSHTFADINKKEKNTCTIKTIKQAFAKPKFKHMEGLNIQYMNKHFPVASTGGIISCLSVVASRDRIILENGGNGQSAGCMNLRLRAGMVIKIEVAEIKKTSPFHTSVYPPLSEPEDKQPQLLLQHYRRIGALLRGEKVEISPMKGMKIWYNDEPPIIALSPNIVTLALHVGYPGGDTACLSGIGQQEEKITWLCRPIQQGDSFRIMTVEGTHSTTPIKVSKPRSREELKSIHSQLAQELRQQGILLRDRLFFPNGKEY